MSPADLKAEREQELRHRLQKFTGRTRRRAAVLTGREELAESVDPEHILRELMDNWPGLENLLVRHGAFYPLIDKVRRIRNKVEHHDGTFTRSRKIHTDAMRSIGMLEMAIRSAGAEEERRRKREAESGPGCRDAAVNPGQPADQPSR